MNQNGDNNYYNNDYSQHGGQGMQTPYYQQPTPIPPMQPQPGMASGGQSNKGGMLLLGMLIGVILTTMVVGGAFVGTRIVNLSKNSNTKQTSAGTGDADSVINDESIKKLEAIEEVINEYYYQDEDIDADKMIEGMYAGMVDSLEDPYSVY